MDPGASRRKASLEPLREVQVAERADVVVHVRAAVRREPDVRDFLEPGRVPRLELLPELPLPGRRLDSRDSRRHVAAPVDVQELPVRAPLNGQIARLETENRARLPRRNGIEIDLALGTARDHRLAVRGNRFAALETDSLGGDGLRLAPDEILDVEAGPTARLVAG